MRPALGGALGGRDKALQEDRSASVGSKKVVAIREKEERATGLCWQGWREAGRCLQSGAAGPCYSLPSLALVVMSARRDWDESGRKTSKCFPHWDYFVAVCAVWAAVAQWWEHRALSQENPRSHCVLSC